MRSLSRRETTETLFDTVKFLNIIEGQLDGQQIEIPVRAYAIQAAYTGGQPGNGAGTGQSCFREICKPEQRAGRTDNNITAVQERTQVNDDGR